MEGTTIISGLKDFLIQLVWACKPELTQSIIQAGFVLAFVTGVTFLFWMYSPPLRSTFGQIVTAIAALAISLQYPVPKRIEWLKGFYCFETVISLLLILFLPKVLALFLTPRMGYQLIVAQWIQKFVWILLIIQLFV